MKKLFTLIVSLITIACHAQVLDNWFIYNESGVLVFHELGTDTVALTMTTNNWGGVMVNLGPNAILGDWVNPVPMIRVNFIDANPEFISGASFDSAIQLWDVDGDNTYGRATVISPSGKLVSSTVPTTTLEWLPSAVTNLLDLPPSSAPVGITNGLARIWNSNDGTVFLRTSRVGATNWKDTLLATKP